jgi:tRNA(Ile)-lysidine synthase
VEYVASKVQSDPQSFRRSDFNSLNEKLKPVVFKALFDKTLNNQAINKGLLNQIDAIQKLQTGQSIDISDTHKLQRDRDLYVFISKSGNKKSLTDSYFSESELRKGILLKHISIIIQSSSTILDQNRLTLDAENVRFPVTIRKWRTGDKFQPLGMAGTQLVSDHLTNRKISSVRKTEAMVLESFDGMIAAIIFPPDKKRIQAGTISEKVRIGEKTQEIIKIEITQ